MIILIKREFSFLSPYLLKLEFHSAMDASCQVWLKLSQWFLIKRVLNFVFYFPLKRDGPSFKPTWIPFTFQESFVPSLVELDPVALEKRNFSLRQCISTISLLSSLGVAFHSNKLESPLPKNWLYQLSLVNIGPVRFIRRNWKCKKLTEGQTDDGQQKLNQVFSSGELKR